MTGATKPSEPSPRSAQWLLQDVAAHFDELVRRARSEGPQHVSIRGNDDVVVLTAEEFRRLKGDHDGRRLIAAMQAAPGFDEIDLEPARTVMPVRDVAL